MNDPVHLITVTPEARRYLDQLPSFIKIGRLLQFSGIVPKDGKVIVKVCKGPKGSTSFEVHKRSDQVILLCQYLTTFLDEMTEINFGRM